MYPLINLVLTYDWLTYMMFNNWWKKVCSDISETDFLAFLQMLIFCYTWPNWLYLGRVWSKNEFFGSNKSGKYFLLKHGPKHSHRTNLTDLWLLVIPRTLFDHWFSKIVQKNRFWPLLVTFEKTSLHGLSFFCKTMHPNPKKN